MKRFVQFIKEKGALLLLAIIVIALVANYIIVRLTAPVPPNSLNTPPLSVDSSYGAGGKSEIDEGDSKLFTLSDGEQLNLATVNFPEFVLYYSPNPVGREYVPDVI